MSVVTKSGSQSCNATIAARAGKLMRAEIRSFAVVSEALCPCAQCCGSHAKLTGSGSVMDGGYGHGSGIARPLEPQCDEPKNLWQRSKIFRRYDKFSRGSTLSPTKKHTPRILHWQPLTTNFLKHVAHTARKSVLLSRTGTTGRGKSGAPAG